MSLILILAGIVFALTPPDSFRSQSVSDHAFGADYYTYEYEATQAAANNAAVAANNLREMGTAQAHYVGVAFIMAGLFGLTHYGQKLFLALPAPQTMDGSTELTDTAKSNLPPSAEVSEE